VSWQRLSQQVQQLQQRLAASDVEAKRGSSAAQQAHAALLDAERQQDAFRAELVAATETFRSERERVTRQHETEMGSLNSLMMVRAGGGGLLTLVFLLA
jgi:hypothetical protein